MTATVIVSMKRNKVEGTQVLRPFVLCRSSVGASIGHGVGLK